MKTSGMWAVVLTISMPLIGWAVDIDGTVKDLSGAPLQGITVTLWGGATQTTTTNASGKYTLTGLGTTLTLNVATIQSGTIFSPAQRIYISLAASQTGQDATGSTVTAFGSVGSGDGQMNSPAGIAVDVVGHRYVVEYGNSRVQKFDAAGAFVAKWTTGAQPIGVAVDAAGNVYVSSLVNDTVVKYSPTGIPLLTLAGLADPAGVALDTRGYIYVAMATGAKVSRFDPTGTFVGDTGAGLGGLNPSGVTVDRMDNMFIGLNASSAIGRFHAVGLTQVNAIAWSSTVVGLNADGEGNVYVAEGSNHRIQKYSSTGVSVTLWGGGPNASPGEFNWAYDVMMDAQGRLHAADFLNHRVQSWSQGLTLYGVQGTVTNAAGQPVSNITVKAEDWPLMTQTSTAGDGTYTLSLVAGSWSMVAFPPAGAFIPGFLAVTLPSSQTGKDFSLAPLSLSTTNLAPVNLSQGFISPLLSLNFSMPGIPVTLTALKVSLTGDCAPVQSGGKISLIFQKDGGDGIWQTSDLTLAVLSSFTNEREGTFTALTEIVGTSTPLYFISTIPITLGDVGSTLGITLVDRTYITVSYPGVVPNVVAGSMLATVQDSPDIISTIVSLAPNTVSDHGFIRQGEERALFHWDIDDTALAYPEDVTMNALVVSLMGNANPSGIRVGIYRENAPYGVFTPLLDISLASVQFDSSRQATLSLNELFEGYQFILGKYLVSFKDTGGTTLGSEIGLSLVGPEVFGVAAPDRILPAAGSTFASVRLTMVAADADILAVDGDTVEPLAVAPSGGTKAFLRLTLFITDAAPLQSGALAGISQLTSISFSLFGLNHLPFSFVAAVQLFKDDGDGMLNAGDALVSQVVGFTNENGTGTFAPLAETFFASPSQYMVAISLHANAEEKDGQGEPYEIGVTLTAFRTGDPSDWWGRIKTPALPSKLDIPDTLTLAVSSPTPPVTLMQLGMGDIMKLAISLGVGDAVISSLRLSVNAVPSTNLGSIGKIRLTLDGENFVTYWMSVGNNGLVTLTDDLEVVLPLANGAKFYTMQLSLDVVAPIGMVLYVTILDSSAVTMLPPDLAMVPVALTSAVVTIADLPDGVKLTNAAGQSALSGSSGINDALLGGVLLQSTSLFPTSGVIEIDQERIAFNGRTTGGGDTRLTLVARGFEGTTAVTHLPNANVLFVGNPFVVADQWTVILTMFGAAVALGSSGEGGVLTALTLTLLGDADPSLIPVRIYKELSAEPGQFGNDTSFNPLIDISIGAGFGDPVTRLVPISGMTSLVSSNRKYYIAVNPPLSLTGKTVGLSLSALNPSLGVVILPPDGLSLPDKAGANSNTPTIIAPGGNVVSALWVNVSPPFLKTGGTKAFLKFDIRTDAAVAQLNGIKVDLAGTVAPEHVTLKCYRDINGDKIWQPTDYLLASATFDVARRATLAGLAEGQTVIPTFYFLVVESSPIAVTGTTVGLSLADQSYFMVAPPDRMFPVTSIGNPMLSLAGTAAVSLAAISTAPASLVQLTALSFLRLTLWTDGPPASWTGIHLSLTGDLSATMMKWNAASGEGGVYLISGAQTLALPGQSTSVNVATRTATITGFNATLTATPSVFELKLSPSVNASVGATMGAAITGAGSFVLTSPDAMAPPLALVASTCASVTDAPDTITVTFSDVHVANVIRHGVREVVDTIDVSANDTLTVTAVTLFLEAGTMMGSSQLTAYVYHDSNGSNLWDGQDLSLSSAVFVGSPGTAVLALARTLVSERWFAVLETGATLGSVIDMDAEFLSGSPGAVAVAPPDSSATATGYWPDRLTVIDTLADVVTVTGTNKSPAQLFTNEDKAMLLLSLKTDGYADHAMLLSLGVELSNAGIPVASAAVTVKLYRDSNADGVWQSADISLATTTFGPDRRGTLYGFTEVITPVGKGYFLVAQLSTLAAGDSELKIIVSPSSSVMVSPPDFVATPLTLQSNTSVVVSSVEVAVMRLLSTFVNGAATMNQGASDVPYVTIQLQNFPGPSTAYVTGVVVSLVSEGLVTGGIEVILKKNNQTNHDSGTLTASSPLLTLDYNSAQSVIQYDIFDITLRAKPTLDATAGARFGFSVNEAASILVLPGTQLTPQNFPATTGLHTTIKEVGDLVQVYRQGKLPDLTPSGVELEAMVLTMSVPQDDAVLSSLRITLGGTIQADAVGIKLFLDDGDARWTNLDVSLAFATFEPNRWATLAPLNETITTADAIYLLVLTIAPGPPAGATVKLPIDVFSAGAILSLMPPDTSIFKPPNVSDVSTLSAPGVDGVRVVAVDVAPDGIAPGGSEAFIRISCSADTGAAAMSWLAVELMGGVDPPFVSLQLYKDDAPNDNIWQATDLLVGSLVAADFTPQRQATFSAIGGPEFGSSQRYYVVTTMAAATPQFQTVGVKMLGVSIVAPDFLMQVVTVNSSIATVDAPDQLLATGLATAPVSLTQGGSTTMMWLTLLTNQDVALWTSLQLSLLGTVNPTLVSAQLKNAAGANVVNSKKFSVNFNMNYVLSSPQLISSTLKVFQLAAEADETAAPGATVGFTLVNPLGGSVFGVNAPDTAVPLTLGTSDPLPDIIDKPEEITIVFTNVASPYMGPNAEQAFVRMSLRVPQDAATWTTMRVSLEGSVPEAAAIVKLYREISDVFGWSPTADSLIATGTFGGDRYATMSGLSETIAVGKPREYYLAVSLSGATSSTTAALEVKDSYVTIAVPDTLKPFNPFSSTSSTVLPPNAVLMTGTNLAPPLLTTGSVSPVVLLSAQTVSGASRLTSLRVSVDGTVSPEIPPGPPPNGSPGVPSSILLKFYRDTNGNGVWDASSDVLVDSSNMDATKHMFLQMDEALTTTPSRFFLVATVDPASGHPKTFRLTFGSEDIGLLSPDMAVPGLAIGSATSTVKVTAWLNVSGVSKAPLTLTQGATMTSLLWISLKPPTDTVVLTALTFVASGAAMTLQFYRDTSTVGGPGVWSPTLDTLLGSAVSPEGGGVAVFAGLNESIGSTGKGYFLAGAPPPIATPGFWSVSLTASALVVAAPDLVNGTGSVRATLAIGDVPETLTVAAAALGPPSHPERGERTYLALTCSVSQDAAVVATLRIVKIGSVGESYVGLVRWYRDNGDGIWNPLDPVLATAPVLAGDAWLGPTPGLTVVAAQGAVTTFVTLELSSSAQPGQTIGLSLPADAAVVLSPDFVSNALPLGVGPVLITPLVPVTLAITSVNPMTTAPQGHAGLTLLVLTIATTSPEWSRISALTLASGEGLSQVWVESPMGTTLGVGIVGTPIVVLMPTAPPVGPAGEGWRVRATLTPLAPIGSLALTLLSVVSAYAVDTVLPFGLTHIGSVTVTDAPDTLTVSPTDGPATALFVGSPPQALLNISLGITSVPPDAVTLTGLRVSLLGTLALTGFLDEGVRLYVYRDGGDGTFDSAKDSVVAGPVTFPPDHSRVTLVSVSEAFTGATPTRYFLAVSLTTSQAYLSTLGLSIQQLTVAGVDTVALNPPTASSLRLVYDQVPHVTWGISMPAPQALTLGAVQTLAGLTLKTDRDTATLTALALSHVTVNGPSVDTDIRPVTLFRDLPPLGLWTLGDESLASGTYLNGRLTLVVSGATGLTLTTTASPFLLRGRLDPFAAGAGTGTLFGVDVTALYASAIVADPAVLSLDRRPLAETPTVLGGSAVDLTSPIALTGEPFLALGFSLATASAGVGVTALLVTVSTDNFQPVSYLSLALVEGPVLLGRSTVPTAVATFPFGQSVVFALSLREPVYPLPESWQLYLTPDVTTPPATRLEIGLGAASVSLIGPPDTMAPTFGVITQSVLVVTGWEYATVSLTQGTAVTPPLGLTVPRGTTGVPLARLLVRTIELGKLARLLAVRVVRIGPGLDADARVRVFLGTDPLATTFEPAAAVEIGVPGSGGFVNRVAVVPLVNKPFLFNVPRVLWLVVDVLPSALPGAKLGLEVNAHSFHLQGQFGTDTTNLPFQSPQLVIDGTAAATLVVVGVASTLTAALQGASSVELGTWTAQVTQGAGSVLTGVAVEILSGASALKGLRGILDGTTVGGVALPLALASPATVILPVSWPVTPAVSAVRLVAELRPSATPGTIIQLRVSQGGFLGPASDTRLLQNPPWTSLALTVQDLPDTVTLTGKGRSVPWELGEWTPGLRLSLQVDHDAVKLVALTLSMNGSLSNAIADCRLMIGDLAVQSSLITHQSSFEVVLTPPLEVVPPLKVLTLELSLSAALALTHTLGLSLSGLALAPDPATGLVVDSLLIAQNSWLGTAVLSCRDPAQPYPPVITVSAFSKETAVVVATWSTSVKQGVLTTFRYAILGGLPATLPALDAWFAGGPLPNGVVVLVPVTQSPIPNPQSAIAMLLKHPGLTVPSGGQYGVALQVQSTAGVWSETGLSGGVLVDTIVPAMAAKAPTYQVGKKQLLLAWEAASSGPSGVASYRIERRHGASPKWEEIQALNVLAFVPSSLPNDQHIEKAWAPVPSAELRGPTSAGGAPALQPVGRDLAPEKELAPYLSATSTVVALEGEGTVYYRVRATSAAGTTSAPTPAVKVVTGLDKLAGQLTQASVYPNPVDTRTGACTMVYVQKEWADVTIDIYTPLGGLVRTYRFTAGTPGADLGVNEVSWDGTNAYGEKVAAGIYLVVLKSSPASGAAASTRVVLKVGVLH